MQDVVPVGGLATVAVHHQPNDRWVLGFTAEAHDVSSIRPRDQPTGKVQVRREKEQRSLAKIDKENDAYVHHHYYSHNGHDESRARHLTFRACCFTQVEKAIFGQMANGFYTRRRFLAASAGAIAGLTLGAEEPAAVIDSHVHFYDPARPQDVPWPPRDDKFLYRTTLPKDYRAAEGARRVTGVVAVEASPWVEDNQWVLDLAAREPLIIGFVGNLAIGTKAFAGNLKRFAANRIFRGVRVRDRKLDGLLDDPDFAGDLKLLAAHDLSLDLAGGMEILPFARRLAEKMPGLRIIIDHLAGLAINGKAPPDDWARGMRALGRNPNIYCKLSGLVEGTGRGNGSAPREVEFYRPALDAMRGIFGAERLMYASDWPVSERFAPLPAVRRIVEEYFQSHGRAEVEAVFSRSAEAVYRVTCSFKTGP